MPRSDSRPNVVVVLVDDMGYSDLGCFGGEVRTPHLDRLGREGVRATWFYNTARCSPSRASLLTGRHPHQTGIGVLTEDLSAHGAYSGSLGGGFPTIAERLGDAGYATCMSGKWHLSHDTEQPDDSWPTRRGFQEFYGIIRGADSYYHPRSLWHGEEHLETPVDDFYLTDALSEHAAGFVRSQGDRPFFLYLAYTAPHWPLQAPETDVLRYLDVYRRGWDELRKERYRRQVQEGLVGSEASLTDRDPSQPAWEDVEDPEWEARRMAVYAAMLERMDAGVGRVLQALEDTGVADDTLVVFLSDNGASAESLPPASSPHFHRIHEAVTPCGLPLMVGDVPTIVPGGADTFASYGRSWANLSNVPFRSYKRWTHEGGIATPLIVSWPNGQLADRSIVTAPGQLTDLLPTVLDAAQVPVPADSPGASLLPALRGRQDDGRDLFWEHTGNGAVRSGRWKLVREADGDWELYDVGADRSETLDVAAEHPHVVGELADRWEAWAGEVGVVPWERLRTLPALAGGR